MSPPDRLTLDAWGRHLGHEPDPGELVERLRAGSLAQDLHATAAFAPDRPALAIDGIARTHGELDEAAGRFAALLRTGGVERGDAVLLAAPSSLAMVEAYLAILRIGATVVLANPTYTASELLHLARHSRAAAAVGSARALDAVRHDVRLTVAVDDPAAAGERPLPVEPAGSDDVALLAYTSGTTGVPKAVPLTHANVLSSIRAAMLAWRFGPDDVLVHSLPLFHQHGLGGVHATLLAGARAVIAGRFDPDETCRMIERERATVLLAVPAIYERLAAWDDVAGADLSSLRLLVSGSAPLSPALARRVEAIAGQLPLERYGTTESGLDLSNLYDGPRRPGTVGFPLPGVELRLTDPEGRPVPDGEEGEIVLRGPQVFAGYRGERQANAASFHPGGWFRTGDLARRDPAGGHVTISGRLKELIISGGLNVYPREVQLALEESPAVERAAVVGVPSERWGEEVVAAVVPAAGVRIDERALLAFAGERLAPYKRPKRIVVLDELPLNQMGKLVRSELVRLMGG
ncbi:MAG: class I adenylate-forming enzyme family protein [Thermoleophilaceae bacterium]